tara:strand:+ start:2380 stop:3327 length:948 start_codon:yes stop_codon:yes gene_type:complete
MKIGFFSESRYEGKVYRDNPNLRTDQAWSCALEAINTSIINIEHINESYDIGICIIPKEENRQYLSSINYPLIKKLKSVCTKVLVMQESTHWDWQEQDFVTMVWYYNQLVDSDGILCHNDIDVPYFEGITGKPAFVLPTLMLEDTIKTSSEKIDKVFVAGNWHTTYRGFDAWVIGREFNLPMTGFKSGKFKENEEQNGIEYLPWLKWSEFMVELSKHKYGVQCYQASAGQFPLNCAYFGIPCVGYNDVNTQRDLFPDISVDRGDIISARKLVSKLKNDSKFYSDVSSLSRENYQSMYSEKVFLNNWNKIVESLNE